MSIGTVQRTGQSQLEDRMIRVNQTDWFTRGIRRLSCGLAEICARSPIISFTFHILGFDYSDPSDQSILDWNNNPNRASSLIYPAIRTLMPVITWSSSPLLCVLSTIFSWTLG